MTGPARLADLRDRATRIATRYPGANMAVRSDVVLALVDAVEAAHLYDGPSQHSFRCEYRTAAKGWKRGDPPIIECICGLDRLADALAGFDFTADQPTTTKGGET